MRVRKRITAAIYNTLLSLGIKVQRVHRPQVPQMSNTHWTFKVGKYVLTAPLEHALPQLLHDHPDYSGSLGRLAHTLSTKYRPLVVIDAGANIGDSAAFIQSSTPSKILCIEGYDRYFSYLEKNAQTIGNITPYKSFLGDARKTIKAQIEENQGTIRLLPKTGKVTAQLVTLDSVIQQYPLFQKAKLFKIDADGYDLKILRGAQKYIRHARPVIHLEYAKFCFEQLGENGVRSLQQLRKLGYNDILFYDNTGRLLITTTLHNARLIQELDAYITKGRGTFSYYDMVLFHQNDSNLAKKFITEETNYFFHKDAQA